MTRIFIGAWAQWPFIDFAQIERVEQFSRGNPRHRQLPTAEYGYRYRRWVLHLRGGRLALTTVQNLTIGKRTCSTLQEIEATMVEIRLEQRLMAWRRKLEERDRRLEDAWTARFATVVQAGRETGYNPHHLRLLARTGKVAAVKRDGRWWIDREDLKRYQARTRPGPKREEQARGNLGRKEQADR